MGDVADHLTERAMWDYEDEDLLLQEELSEIQVDEGPPNEELEEAWLEPGPWRGWDGDKEM